MRCLTPTGAFYAFPNTSAFYGRSAENRQISSSSDLALHLLEKVVDALIPHRPDWVIRTSIKQAERIIVQTQSKLYPVAARWLERAKKAYLHKGQDGEWKAYINNLRVVYAKRPALQRAIEKL